MEPYAIVFCLLASLAVIELYFTDVPTKWLIGLACVVILTAFSGIRWETGNDWANYLDNYRLSNSLYYRETEFELGYRAIVAFSRWIGLNYTGFLLLSSLISNSAYVYVLSRLGPVAVLTLLFFCSFYLGYMGTQRQTLAGGFACLGMLAAYDRRWIVSVVLITVATQFHISATVCFVALIVPRQSVPLWLLTAASVAIGIVALAAGPIVARMIENTVSNGFIVGKLLSYTIKEGADMAAPANLALASLKRAVLAVVFVILCRTKAKGVDNYVLNLYLVSIGLFFLFVGIIPLLALRIGLYFTFFENFLVYSAIIAVSGRYWRESVLSIGIMFSIVRLYWGIVAYEPELFTPYKTIWANDHRRFVQ